jgi:hypothetical protein
MLQALVGYPRTVQDEFRQFRQLSNHLQRFVLNGRIPELQFFQGAARLQRSEASDLMPATL